jgi:CheY-like chemotaxis protein
VKVLVVDDNLDTCRVLVRLVETFNGPASCVESGPAALKFLEGERPNLVFLDYMMPGMSGLEVLRAMRGDPKFSSIPVVMFSAASDPDLIREALAAGAQDFLVKGDIAGLLTTVKRYVSGFLNG